MCKDGIAIKLWNITLDEYDLIMEYRKEVLKKELKLRYFQEIGIEKCVTCSKLILYHNYKIISCDRGILLIEVHCEGQCTPYTVSFTPYTIMDLK